MAGAFDAASELLAVAAAGPLNELQQARVDLTHGQIAFVTSMSGDAPPILARVAKRLEPLDPVLARQTYLEAWYAALFAGRFAGTDDLREISRAARAVSSHSDASRPPDLLLEALAVLVTEGRAAAAPLLRRSAWVFAEGEISPAERLRWSPMAAVAASALWDEKCWYTMQSRELRFCREAGMLGPLGIWVNAMAVLETWRGDLTEAASLVAEAEAIATATGSRGFVSGVVMLAAFRGSEAEAAPLIERAIEESRASGQGVGEQLAQWVKAVLNNGLGRYEEALVAAQAAQAAPGAPEMHVSMWALSELIEAAGRTGRTRQAAQALDRLAEATSIGDGGWGPGLYVRSQALLSDGAEAESRYREAVDLLGRTGIRTELARAHLLYGEWLRREGRRTDARTQLRIAYEMCDAIGMRAFADRAYNELLATGETTRKRTADESVWLTPQEGQIARMARTGLSNPEIAAQLFLSPRTVEYHLRKVFTKLGITSRHQLQQALPVNGHDRR
ncbi:helix-turn-helix transcriptional regulator [Nonomuraea antri]|uniref:helix-turn-helix transcriptional regulator n=1 Tax=Nonomuraea antri TaxID=2730852 RepID=UPI001C2C9B01|nr:helix-turn-helix transcriptional regulator [Nonomuraea antri]